MIAKEFIAKWQASTLKERSASQSHFNDLCALIGHPNPVEADPTGEHFTFERGAAKTGGGEGWADVWKKGVFCLGVQGEAQRPEKPPLLSCNVTPSPWKIRRSWSSPTWRRSSFTPISPIPCR